MKYLKFIMTSLILLFVISCNKLDLPFELPAPTQIGANTFGCIINGEVWRVKTEKDRKKQKDEGVFAFIEDSILSIRAADLGWLDEIPNYAFSLRFRINSLPNSYTTKNEGNFIRILDRKENGIKFWQQYFSDTTSILTITRIDRDFVAGKFEGKLVHTGGGSDLLISDGRFDIKLE